MRSLVLSAVLAFVLAGLSSVPASGYGELSGGIGGTWPQGSFAAYGDPGPRFLLRAEAEIPGVPALAGWISVDYAIFSSETFDTEATTGDIDIPLEQTNEQDALSIHAGIQLGSSSHKAFFRPRVGVGVGFYYFSTDVELRHKGWTSEDEDNLIYREVLDSQFRFGWRGVVGADFYPTSKWGLFFEAVYDHVFDLNQIEGDEEAERTSRFQGFTMGVVFPFE
jgi:opacity protein-like surface antigen